MIYEKEREDTGPFSLWMIDVMSAEEENDVIKLYTNDLLLQLSNYQAKVSTKQLSVTNKLSYIKCKGFIK